MKFFEVNFILKIGESEFPLSVTHAPPEFYVSTADGKCHNIHRTKYYWKTDSRQIVMYINEIRKQYREIIQNFKWELPDNLKAVIYLAKLETRPPGLTIMLEYNVDAKAFHELLSRHLGSKHIKPVMPVQIYDAKNSQLIDLRLSLKGSKGHFVAVRPVTKQEIEQIFWPKSNLKK